MSLRRHFDRLIDEKSIKVIDDFHARPMLKKNFELEQLKFSTLGSLSYLKPMIEENNDSIIESPTCRPSTSLYPKDQCNEIPSGESKLPSPSMTGGEDSQSSGGSHSDGDEPMNTDNLLRDPKAFNVQDSLSKTKKNHSFQMELHALLSSYRDLLYTNESIENMPNIQQAYVSHILGHLMYSRSKIVSNNKLFGKQSVGNLVANDDPKLRDQGFTRARILCLLPFRYSALKLGKCIADNLKETHNIVHLDRFIQEFGDGDGVDSTTRPIACDGHKPSDYYQTFHGNVDDSFRIGLKITKNSIKFFSDFYNSDIIIASPLGLKTLITPPEDSVVEASAVNEEYLPVIGDKDFLSSIEIVILDQAEIFLMQNWEHVIDVMQHLNHMPSKPRKMDISRVHLWHLENWSKYYRQLLIFTSITVPLVHSFFQTYSFNYEGYVAFKHRVEYVQAKKLITKATQSFLYYDSPSARDSCDNRFNFFVKSVLPRFIGLESSFNTGGNNSVDTNQGPLGHTLIFVSSYFDYVRLRNHFRREKLSFTQICEYTEENKTSKARQLFYFGARQFLIYTERCHFYHRYKIKGVRNIIFYEPPVFAKFYMEMIELLCPELQGKKFIGGAASQFSAITLFSNHDTLQLGSIIGFNNAAKLIQNKRSIT